MEFVWPVIQWLDRHFTALMYIWLIVVLAWAATWLTLRLRTLPWGDVFLAGQKLILRLLHIIVSIGLTVMTLGIVLLGLHKWLGPYQTQGPLPIEGDTFWVHSPERIFFIDGTDLISLLTDGSDRRVVVAAETPLRAYHFSPDAARVLALTDDVIWVGCTVTSCAPQRIVSYRGPADKADASSSYASSGQVYLSETAWSPDGTGFVFLKRTASDVSRVLSWVLYDFKKGRTTRIRTEPLRIKRMYWDQEGRTLYGYETRALDLTYRAASFMFYWYRWLLPLTQESRPKRVAVFTALSDDPLDIRKHLTARGIVLFNLERRNLFYQGMPSQYQDRTPDGRLIGIDKDGYLFYKGKGFFTKRYYRVPRTTPADPRERTVVRPGEWVITRLAWLPSGRYVIMEHRRYGLVLFDPRSGRMGIIENKKGHSFGWPTPITPSS